MQLRVGERAAHVADQRCGRSDAANVQVAAQLDAIRPSAIGRDRGGERFDADLDDHFGTSAVCAGATHVAGSSTPA